MGFMLPEQARRSWCIRLVAACAVVVVGLAGVSLAGAAPRPSGSMLELMGETGAPAAAGGAYVRSDMPRPSGTVTPLGLEDGLPASQAVTATVKLPEKKAAASAVADSPDAADDNGWSSDADCASCHDLDDIREATKDSAVLTDVNGTVVNPHDLPEVAEHAEVVCAGCHKTHEVTESTAKSAARACASCHHADVYECYTCHA